MLSGREVMKLIVQIPCFNEERTLPQTVAEIPREVAGFDVVELLVVDDGSSDRTAAVARECGVDHVVRHRVNRGLAAAFRTGLEAALRLGADVIVNTDGDNQYPGAEIPRLVAPIVAGEADLVVGDRQTATLAHFSLMKKALTALGSRVVRRLSGAQVRDVVSGFRAFSREAALRMNIVSPFSYTIETTIQAGKKRMATRSVPIKVNAPTRRSRLAPGIATFIARSGKTLLRLYAMYEPFRLFFYLGLLLMVVGAVPVGRFLYLYLQGQGSGHLQSLVLGGVAITLGVLTVLSGLLADIISFNRQLLEQLLETVRREELTRGVPLEETGTIPPRDGATALAPEETGARAPRDGAPATASEETGAAAPGRGTTTAAASGRAGGRTGAARSSG